MWKKQKMQIFSCFQDSRSIEVPLNCLVPFFLSFFLFFMIVVPFALIEISISIAGPKVSLENAFPSGSLIDSPYDSQIITKTEVLLSSLDSLRSQRSSFYKELKDLVPLPLLLPLPLPLPLFSFNFSPSPYILISRSKTRKLQICWF